MARRDGTASRSGDEATRRTVPRLLRLTPEEDAALVAVAMAMAASKGATLDRVKHLPLARVVGHLALDEMGRRSATEAHRKHQRKK